MPEAQAQAHAQAQTPQEGSHHTQNNHHHHLPPAHSPTLTLQTHPQINIMNDQQPTSRSRFRFPSSFKNNKDTVPQLAASRPSLRKPQSAASLQRHPSAPVFPRLHTPLSSRESPSHLRTKSNTYGSSNSSIDQISAGPSPILPGSETSLPTSARLTDSQHSHLSASTQSSRDDLTSAPFEKFGISKSFTFDSNSKISPSANRPAPPPLHHTHTSPEPRGLHLLHSPSTNDRMMEVTPPRSDNGTTSPKRYSDDSSSGKPSITGRKKSGFSSFMNSMLGSPRNIKISAPENPIHMIHVGYDNVTGQFTVSLKSEPICLHLVLL
jgi:p21-activated kinase 1